MRNSVFKRMGALFLAVALLLLPLLLAGCETTLGGTHLPIVDLPTEGFDTQAWETEHYLFLSFWEYWVHTWFLVDKVNGETRPFVLQYAANDRFAAGVAPTYLHLHGLAEEGEGFSLYAYAQVCKYDENTGVLDEERTVYYRTKLCFDLRGKELSHTDNGVALTKAEMEATVAAWTEQESYFEIYFANGGRDYDVDKAPEEAVYTPVQRAVLTYAEQVEKVYRNEYYSTCGYARPIGDRVYFSITQSNRKNWGSQRAIMEGIYRCSVTVYDPASGSFEEIFSSDRGEYVLAFDEHYVLTTDKETKHLYAYELASGARQTVDCELGEGNAFTVGSYLIVADYANERYTVYSVNGSQIAEGSYCASENG